MMVDSCVMEETYSFLVAILYEGLSPQFALHLIAEGLLLSKTGNRQRRTEHKVPVIRHLWLMHTFFTLCVNC